ncbi:ATP-binding cassette domain-containing protein [Halothiobacillus sp. DCM-1]|uniref:ABC transporter ATP-binding protein n=1 Tax=Halothiobacillus sp. DCM-1 TaxID=3112558 RepID=UPI0032455E0A
MLEVCAVCAAPNGGVAYQPVTLVLRSAQIITLFGASGVGKSQFLRALADLAPHQGEVRLDGQPQTAFKPAAWRQVVGYVPAEPAWWADSARAHFAEAPDPRWLEALALAPSLLDTPVEHLSTGERQRLALLRALVLKPRVLLLDEPTANLDAHNAARMRLLVQHYVREQAAAALWVSHDAEERRVLGGESIELTAAESI